MWRVTQGICNGLRAYVDHIPCTSIPLRIHTFTIPGLLNYTSHNVILKINQYFKENEMTIGEWQIVNIWKTIWEMFCVLMMKETDIWLALYKNTSYWETQKVAAE